MLYEEANWFERLIRRLGGVGPISRFFSLVMPPLDRLVSRLTNRRTTFVQLASGLPVALLATTGARSGVVRSAPVVPVPLDDGDLAVIASNFGKKNHPAWFYNLRAHPEATVTLEGESFAVVAEQVDGVERDAIWRQALRMYPSWQSYERRAAGRRIAVFRLRRRP